MKLPEADLTVSNFMAQPQTEDAQDDYQDEEKKESPPVTKQTMID